MRLIKPQFEIWEQEPGIDGIYKAIERAGRICYRSENKITEDSAKGFVDRMIKSGHGAMLEHGTVYLAIPIEYEYDEWGKLISEHFLSGNYPHNKYSKCIVVMDEEDGEDDDCSKYGVMYITTNLRVLVENNWLDDLKYICEPTEYHAKRVTVKFILSRSIAQEYTRHRVFSYSMESQRYCNYSTDKFSNEVTFIQPCWLDDERLKLYGPYHTVIRDKSPESIFIANLNNSERDYLDLIGLGWKPQQAREVLLNACKTELIMTGFVDDWWGQYLVINKETGLIDKVIPGRLYTELNNIDREKYRIVEKGFFPLRCSNAAHPQAQELAIPLREEFVKRVI